MFYVQIFCKNKCVKLNDARTYKQEVSQTKDYFAAKVPFPLQPSGLFH